MRADSLKQRYPRLWCPISGVALLLLVVEEIPSFDSARKSRDDFQFGYQEEHSRFSENN